MNNERLLLDLVNSRLVAGKLVHDELADDAAAIEWLRSRGAEYGPVQVEDARALRDAMTALLRGLAPVTVLDPWVSAMQRNAELDADGLEWVDTTPAGKRVGAALVQQWAALQDPTGSRIRPCAAADCQHFLIDHSRANNRRWHSMATCGNREKARRHYARTQTATARP